ncbi:tRNA (guanine37-N1)-methyltransferase [Paragonimus westermani]|uniref:tRNA (Guanine37-N1)-methyltransferase n=1 Tax=Paragonimus westermani TaxID=34504 RepID=A0A5J4NP15_9TREM|nr:tRNA (guanine37-N1)-methyltransferase [Paragonimus westermani]
MHLHIPNAALGAGAASHLFRTGDADYDCIVEPLQVVLCQLVLDKLPHIRTVIHKAAVIESDYRNFQLDLMAGEPNYVTTVKENNLIFHLDISKVYWNSRLGTEHARIVDRLCSPFAIGQSGKPTAIAANEVIVYDVFAGVGPFAVPAARLGCRVFANDLNPDSYQWLLRNVQENRSRKKPMQSISCTNMDGRAFIHQVLLPNYWKTVRSDTPPRRYVTIMNLPALAPDFLDAFINRSSVPTNVVTSVNDSCDSSQTFPFNHLPLDMFCYCFLRRNEESEETIKLRIAKALGETASVFTPSESATTSYPKIQAWSLRFVRNVAPYKDMFCAEFQLFLPPPSFEKVDIIDPATKRPRMDNVA